MTAHSDPLDLDLAFDDDKGGDGGSRMSVGGAASRGVRWLLITLLVLIVYYWGGAELAYEMDADLDYTPPAVAEGSPDTVDMLVGLIRREINDSGWVHNDPPFYATWMLENMPEYQIGMFEHILILVQLLRDEVGRPRDSDPIDEDLRAAAGDMGFPGDHWRLTGSLIPQRSSEDAYLDAADRIAAYGERVAAGRAQYVLRDDNIIDSFRIINGQLGGASSQLEEHVRQKRFGLFDLEISFLWEYPAVFLFGSGEERVNDLGQVVPAVDTAIEDDDLFYRNRGMLYAYYMVLSALKQDIVRNDASTATIILGGPGTDATLAYTQMLDSLRDGAAIKPLIVMNAEEDSLILPNHLAAQGFFLQRARARLQELIVILQN